MSAGFSQEAIAHAFQTAQRLKAQGLDESSSPELSRALDVLRSVQAARAAATAPNGVQTNGAAQANGSEHKESTPQVHMTPAQLALLRCQVYAWKLLSKGSPVPANIQEACSSPELALKLIEHPQPAAPAKAAITEAAATTAPQGDEDEQDYDEAEAAKDTPESSAIYPYHSFVSPLEALEVAISLSHDRLGKPVGFLAPILMPHGIDPHTLREERDRYVAARLQQRIRELEKVTALLDGPAKSAALIELKQLKLVDRQKALRHDVMRGFGHAMQLSLITERTAHRRGRKIGLRDARMTESLERSQATQHKEGSKQQESTRIESLELHARSMMSAHAALRSAHSRLGRAVNKFHADAEREETKRIEKVSKDRLKALKADDEDAYLALIDHTKDTRIGHLISQTDQYLTTLSAAVRKQQSKSAATAQASAVAASGGKIDESTFGAAPVFEDEDNDGGSSSKDDYYNSAHKIKEAITEQPRMLSGGELKEYQIKGLQWMISLYNNNLNGILADEMGLGKTIQTIALITHLIEHKNNRGPFLVIVPLSTMTNWELEFRRWAPELVYFAYKGSPTVRRDLQTDMGQTAYNVLLTTYEYIIKDRPFLGKIRWAHMIIDEGHRMKNAQSKLSQTLTQYYISPFRLILTGTPLQNNLPELWALLNFVLPSVFNSAQSFDEWFNAPFAGAGSQEKIALNEEEALLVIRRLHKVLRPFLLRRLKKDVESELPDKVERVIKVKKSALQEKLYAQMKQYNTLFVEGIDTDGRQAGLKGLNNTLMQLRKICNHPFTYKAVEEVFKNAGGTEELLVRVSGKFELLDRMLPKLFKTGHRILMFFQMTQIMDIMQDYLAYRHILHLRLDGNTSHEARATLLTEFNAPDSPYNMFLLSTRAGGLGLNLQTADTVIIYDSDWNPHQDLQAQDRAHRIGQKKEVRIFRLVTSGSIEEVILERSRTKLDMDKKVIQGGRFDNKSTAQEREQFLLAILEAEPEDEDEAAGMGEEELNDVLARGDEEADIFARMDEEREREDLLRWRNTGQTGPAPERLLPENELPAVFKVDPAEIAAKLKLKDELQFDAATGRRVRSSRAPLYDEDMTDEQWLAMLEADDPDVVGDLDAKRSAKLKARGISPMDGDSLRGSPGPGRKRGRPSANASVDGDTDRDSKKRKTDDKLFAVYKAAIDLAASPTLVNALGYAKSAFFLELPNRDDYPDYCACASFQRLTLVDIAIQQPISMKQIRGRIARKFYKSPEQYLADWDLMAANAKAYNEDGSPISLDAQDLCDLVRSHVQNAIGNSTASTRAASPHDEKPNISAPASMPMPPTPAPAPVASTSSGPFGPFAAAVQPPPAAPAPRRIVPLDQESSDDSDSD